MPRCFSQPWPPSLPSRIKLLPSACSHVFESVDDEPDGADSGGNGVGGSLDRQIRSVEAVLEDLRRRRIISGAGGIVSPLWWFLPQTC